MANWDYMIIEAGTARLVDELDHQLRALGSLGWEVVGFAAMDKTIGLNSVAVILKREIASLPTPADVTAGWYPDPSARFELRHWDGFRWSEHVSTGGQQSTDFPNVRS